MVKTNLNISFCGFIINRTQVLGELLFGDLTIIVLVILGERGVVFSYITVISPLIVILFMFQLIFN